jgi:hypothetical protein
MKQVGLENIFLTPYSTNLTHTINCMIIRMSTPPVIGNKSYTPNLHSTSNPLKSCKVSILKLLEDEISPDDHDDYDVDDESDSSYDCDETSENDDTTEPETLTNELDSSWNIKEMNDVLESLESNLKSPLVW